VLRAACSERLGRSTTRTCEWVSRLRGRGQSRPKPHGRVRLNIPPRRAAVEIVPGSCLGQVRQPDTEGRPVHPCTLVQGSDSLFDFRITDYQKPPALHVAAAGRADTCFQDFSDQFVRHRVWFQPPPHRPGGANDLERSGPLRCDWKLDSTREALETKPATISLGIPQGLHAALAYRDHR
jgi:hypothetical protein